ncbi:MAG TPA: hypothetical protein VF105_05185 [Gemmatimonadaceae bacterium]
MPGTRFSTLTLFQTFSEKKDQLLVAQSLEGADGKVHRNLASIVAVESDGHGRRLHATIG